MQRAQDAGYRALVITMDTPFVGRRPRSIRKPLEFSGDILGNFRGMNVPGGDMLQYFSEQIDPSITWEDIEGFARQTSLPVIMK